MAPRYQRSSSRTAGVAAAAPAQNGAVTTETMLAWEVGEPGPVATRPLRPVHRAIPEPGPDELLVRVTASAVCRTDLHLAEGDLPPRRPGTVPGHEVVGEVLPRLVAAAG